MIHVIWDLDDDPRGNVRHIPIDEHLTKDDVANAVNYPLYDRLQSRTNRRKLLGPAEDGRLLIVIYEPAGADTIYPITAYYVEE